MLKKRYYIFQILALGLFGLSAQNNIYSDSNYHDFYIFGDSLNDANPDSKSVSGSIFPPQGYYVSMALFGKPVTGYKVGGHVIALSGNQITKTLWFFPNLSNLYQNPNYFTQSQIGENNLYYLAIGSNDPLMSNLVIAPFPELDIFRLSQLLINTRSEYAKNMLVQLGNHGKNTIITSNLLQMDLTPMFPTLRTFPRWDIVSAIDTSILANQFHWRFNGIYQKIQDFINIPAISEVIYQLGFVTDYKIRRLADDYKKPEGMNGSEYIKYFRDNMFQKSLIGNLISPIWNIFQNHLARVIGQYTEDYSNALIGKYFATNENIVFLDFRSLLLEAFDRPQEFGIDNYTVTQCPSGISSVPDSICRAGTPYFYEDQKYLFGDFVHPSAYAHEMIGNYIISVLSAPVLFSSLIKHAENSSSIHQQQINSQLTPLRFNGGNLNTGFSSFVSYYIFSGNTTIKQQGVETKKYFSNYLNIGGVYVIDNSQTIGIITSIEVGKAKPYQFYQFNPRGLAVSIFYQLTLKNNLWFNFNIGGEHLKANNIKRTIAFNSKFNRIEEGETSVQSYHANIKTGYDFEINPRKFLSPYLGFSANHSKTKGYAEKSQRSTATQFDNLEVDQNYVSLGLQHNIIKDNLRLGLDVSINHNLSNPEKSVSSGLKTSPRNFTRLINLNEKNWGTAQLNFTNQINQQLQLNVNAGIQYSKKSKSKLNLSFGFNKHF